MILPMCILENRLLASMIALQVAQVLDLIERNVWEIVFPGSRSCAILQ